MAKEEIGIEFYTDVKALAAIPELHPKPMKAFTPSWWKDMPAQAEPDNRLAKTVKVCPSFPDFFSLGYVIPMWTDTLLKYNWRDKSYKFEYGQMVLGNQEGTQHGVSTHMTSQFLDHTPTANFLGKPSNFVFKFVCPWYAKTAPGYSLMQLPMFYNFNGEFSVMPGVIDSDIHHVINQQVVYHGDGEEIFIKKGTPIAQYIPFKRSSYTATSQAFTPEFKEENDISLFKIASSFEGAYREAQRERDRKDG
jgi:hypothetical protein